MASKQNYFPIAPLIILFQCQLSRQQLPLSLSYAIAETIIDIGDHAMAAGCVFC
jgi:hypothetical protein